jgi:hypothetical protein
MIKEGCFLSSFASKTKAQVTLFIIIALIIIGGIGIYYVAKNVSVGGIPGNLKPAYDNYISCLSESAKQGIALLGERGGYIKLPEFSPGSGYMPFSSQLNFLGEPVAYWMYVSGNNIVKEQMPTKTDMEKQLNDYIKERVAKCDFSEIEKQGFIVSVDTSDVSVSSKISDLSVEVTVNAPASISLKDNTAVVNKHTISVDSKLGKFYSMATGVYDYEKKNMFLENYALDVLKLYAPVTGVDLSCAPKIFIEDNVRTDLKNALEVNIPTIKLQGNYYSLADKEQEYFVVNTGKPMSENVNIIYSKDFPTKIEMFGDKVINPVGLQAGLGILGFCYVPYHFVYDMSFPVLIQFYDTKEIFQFPVAVVIKSNSPREAVSTETAGSMESEICNHKTQSVQIKTYDMNLNGVEANIQYKCMNEECYIGKTTLNGNDATLNADMPSCVNGLVIATAEGYAETKQFISTNSENFANIAMSKLHEVPVEINAGNNVAIVSFVSDKYSTNVYYPDMKTANLMEGYYNVTAYIYKNSTIKFPATADRKCFNVIKSGVPGYLGFTEEKCFDVNTPEQEAGFVVIGGGKSAEYVAENKIQGAGVKMTITAPYFDTPTDLKGMQNNYLKVDDSSLDISYS